MVVIEFQKLHFVIAFRTIQRVIAEREEDGSPPLSKTAVDLMFFFWCGIKKVDSLFSRIS